MRKCVGNQDAERSMKEDSDTELIPLMATFNEQLGPIYEILEKLQYVKLASSLLEPEPTEGTHER